MNYNLEKTRLAFNEKPDEMDFIFFWGHRRPEGGNVSKSCFSQWFPSYFEHEGEQYYNAEQWMMAGKAKLFKDEAILAKILQERAPKKIKSLGRKVHNFEQKLWSENAYAIVKEGNLLKFSYNNKFKDFLLNTGDKVLVEASPYDMIWGIGLTEQDQRAQNPNEWQGSNYLGFVLMEVRDLLRAAK